MTGFGIGNGGVSTAVQYETLISAMAPVPPYAPIRLWGHVYRFAIRRAFGWPKESHAGGNLGPVVFGIAAAQELSDVAVGMMPEAV